MTILTCAIAKPNRKLTRVNKAALFAVRAEHSSQGALKRLDT